MFFDVVMWLIVAKVAVMLFEDSVYAARGKKSPRLKERQQRRAAEGGTDSRPSGAWARTRAALGGYAAGLVEDAATAARASRRRRAARRHGRKAVDGVLVELDDDGGFYADCDVCGWSSRRFQVEDNARAAGAEHARGHHTGDTTDTTDTDERSSDTPEPPRRLRVIPGGAADTTPTPPTPEAPATEPTGDDEPTDPAGDEPIDPNPTGGNPAAGTDPTLKEQLMNLDATGPEQITAAFRTAIEAANEQAEDVNSVAAVLTEAADRFESMKIAGSTVALVRDAAHSVSDAATSLESAAEELESALTDYNNRDGKVAEAVAEAGNLASEEALVG